MKKAIDPDSIDVTIMKTVAQFEYLVNIGESLTMSELQHRAQFYPGIMEEPELQRLVQIISDSTIKQVSRNNAGYWYNF
jgi:hypothetical protein